MLVLHIVGEEFESCVVRWARDSGSAVPFGVVPSGVLLFEAMGRRSGRSADVLITEVLFFGVLVLDDLYADVPFIIVSFVCVIVDVPVAKVMVYRILWQVSSGAWSSSCRGGF